MIVRCIVAAINADGEPDFFFVKVDCTKDEYENGDHYDAARQAADNEGYGPRLVYDENDAGGKAILDHFVWESASTVKV